MSSPLLKRAKLFDKMAKAAVKAQTRRIVFHAVSVRDEFRCRACDRRVTRTLAAVPDRIEHHHVIPRSLGGEDTTKNVALLCLSCHTKRHVTGELTITGNANRSLTFTEGGRTWRG